MPANPPSETEYVCHGLTWSTGQPRLLLAPLPTGPLDSIEIMNRRVGLAVADTARYCTGRYRFTDTFQVEPVPCPGRSPAERGGQCAACGRLDEFRLAHRFHQGGRVPESLARYMAQPHWLYLATFADGRCKVGTAAEPRKRSRVDEQGPLLATYLTRSPDGAAVRLLEDAVTAGLGITQSVTGAAKLAALADLVETGKAETAHEHAVQQTAELLASLDAAVAPEPWEPPAEGGALRTPGRRTVYPHDLRRGTHGFAVEACMGSIALIRTTACGPDHVLDFGAIKGRRVSVGEHCTPEAVTQDSLF